MRALDMFQKRTLTDIARELELHPFEVARVLGSSAPLPRNMRFEDEDVARVSRLAGVETWWADDTPLVEDDVRGRALVRTAIKLLLDRGEVGATTRADNLFRGLDPADQWLVRRAVNQLIRGGVLQSVPAAAGLTIQVTKKKVKVLEGVVDGTDIPESLEALWS